MKHFFFVILFFTTALMPVNAVSVSNQADSLTMDSVGCDIAIEGLVSEVSCKGGQDGKIDLSLSGSGIETVTWSHGEVSEDVTQLEAGSYSVLVKSTTCSKQAVFIVNEPENHLLVTKSLVQPPSCADRVDASIELEIKGGTEPYLVYLDTLVSHGAFYSLKPGIYSLKINDSKLCSIELQVNIPEVQAMQIQLGEDIAIQSGETIEIDAGAGFSKYLWSSGDRGQIISFSKETDKLITEQLSVTVTDQNDCTHQSNIKKITVYPSPLIESSSDPNDAQTNSESVTYSETEAYSATATISDTTAISETESYSE